MKKTKRGLFQYPETFNGTELIRSSNRDTTEVAAWLSNPTGPGSLVLLGFVKPDEWDEFQQDFDKLVNKYIVGLQCSKIFKPTID